VAVCLSKGMVLNGQNQGRRRKKKRSTNTNLNTLDTFKNWMADGTFRAVPKLLINYIRNMVIKIKQLFHLSTFLWQIVQQNHTMKCYKY
jgi:hypothetical protein